MFLSFVYEILISILSFFWFPKPVAPLQEDSAPLQEDSVPLQEESGASQEDSEVTPEYIAYLKSLSPKMNEPAARIRRRLSDSGLLLNIIKYGKVGSGLGIFAKLKSTDATENEGRIFLEMVEKCNAESKEILLRDIIPKDGECVLWRINNLLAMKVLI